MIPDLIIFLFFGHCEKSIALIFGQKGVNSWLATQILWLLERIILLNHQFYFCLTGPAEEEGAPLPTFLKIIKLLRKNIFPPSPPLLVTSQPPPPPTFEVAPQSLFNMIWMKHSSPDMQLSLSCKSSSGIFQLRIVLEQVIIEAS